MFLDKMTSLDAENDIFRPKKWPLDNRKMTVFRPAKWQLPTRKMTALGSEDDVHRPAKLRL